MSNTMTPQETITALALAEFRRRHPTIPEHAFPKFRFCDKTANGLTKMIIEYIRLRGGLAERINSMGIYDQKLKQYRPSGSRKGTADVSATFKGKSLRVEVKIGADRQSDDQRKYELEHVAAGGYYFIAKNFTEFYQWFNQNFE